MKNRIPRKLKKKLKKMGGFARMRYMQFKNITPKAYEGVVGGQYLADEFSLWQH